MIEKREEASKDAPTEEVKNNVNKIYNEVTSGGMFSSLTQGIRGIFSGRRAEASSNVAGQGSVNTAPTTSFSRVTSFSSKNTASTANSVAIRKFIFNIEQIRNTERPDSYRAAKALLNKIRLSCETQGEICGPGPYDYEINYLLQMMVLPFIRGFRQEIKRDQGVKNDLRFLKDWLSERIPNHRWNLEP